MSSMSIKEMNDQLKDKEVEIFTLKETIEELNDDLKAYKKFFGYEEDMSLQDMKNYKEECDGEETVLRENDKEYADKCEKTEKLSDLVIQLGEKQYMVAELYSQIRELSGGSTLRRDFTSDFIALKDAVAEDDVDDFFDILDSWIQLQREIHAADKNIAELND